MSAYTALFRALLDEAASGTSPTTVVDSEGTADLTPNYATSLAAYTTGSNGRGVQFTHTHGAASGAQLLGAASSLNSGLGGANEASLSARFTITGTAATRGTIVVLGHLDGGGGLLRLSIEPDGFGGYGAEAAFGAEDTDGANLYQWAYFNLGSMGAGEHTISVVWDTTQATANNRCKLWLDKTEITDVVENIITQNTTIRTIGSSDRISIGSNVARTGQAFQGTVWAVEFGFGQLTTTQINDIHDAWAVDNDVDPLASGGGSFQAAWAANSNQVIVG